MLNKEELSEIIMGFLPEAGFAEGTQLPEVIAPTGNYVTLAQFLKTDNRLKFDYLISHTAIDNGTHFTVVNHLESTEYRHILVLKTIVEDHENGSVDSLAHLFPTAEFFEREVFDLFGIRYINHPNPERLFLEEGYGFPLRKDFRDEINFIER